MVSTRAHTGRNATILYVDTRCGTLRRIGDSLTRAGYDVIEAASFEDAKHAIMSRPLALLVSHLRLAAFNGLHLVHLGRLVQPDLQAIVISTEADAVLQDEAHRIGATLIVEPVHTPTLVSAIARCIDPQATAESDAPRVERRERERRRQRIPDFSPDRRIADRRAVVAVVARPWNGLTEERPH